MKRTYRRRIAVMASLLAVLFIVVFGFGLRLSSDRIQKQVLLANENDAVDIATIIGNNFSITDAEVTYLKSLSFSEMEIDPINRRLVDTVAGISLNNQISNIYVMILLPDDEVRYTVDAHNADALGFKAGTRLNGMWLLNGKFNNDGTFLIAQRDDIYRYLEFCTSDQRIFESRRSFGLISEDVWGRFITGYVPLYSSEGTYVGILGVDMDMNMYNDKVTELTSTIFFAFAGITLVLIALFLIFFAKYQQTKEGVLYYDFYSRLSHDMRTPMNGILGIAALAKDEHDPDVLQEDIRKMETSGKYLLALVNDTLDFQKMQGGKLTLHKEITSTQELISDIKNMVTETAKKKGIRFVTEMCAADMDAYILADSMRLKQIFVNLLSNAVKFTPEGGSVVWTIQLISRDGSIAHTKITVQDTGVGMSRKFLKNDIFKPFSQEYNAASTKYAGSGLGLSIVKSLVQQMHGHIEVESEQGEGTTFTVYLDIETVDKAEAESKLVTHSMKNTLSASALKGKRILLIEDHPLNAEIARKLLEKCGCIVTWLDNGQKAVHAVSQSSQGAFDAILMDIRMPVMDGLEATKQIRALNHGDAKTIPIIAMTANAYEEDIKASHDAGMNAHLAKPIDPKTLFETLAAECIKK